MHKRWLILPAVAAALLTGCDRPGRESGGRPEAVQDERRATARYTSDRDDLPTDMRSSFVPFTFEYPEGWERQTGRGNFVQVAAPRVNGAEPLAFVVGAAEGSGDPAQDRRMAPALLAQFQRQMRQTFDDFEVAWEGPTRVGRYDSQSFAFTGRASPTNGGAATRVTGRLDIVIRPGQQRGLMLFSLVTDRSGDELDPREIGRQGTFRQIFDSLTIGEGA